RMPIKDVNGVANFKLAGSTLGIGVKIYCSRVDSLRINTNKFASSLTNKLNKSACEQQPHAEDENNQARQTGSVPQQRRKKKLKTLELEANLTLEAIANMPKIDPLFMLLNNSFDITSLDCLLMNNVKIGRDGQLILDSEHKATVSQSLADNKQMNVEIDTKLLQDAHKLQLCPRLSKIDLANRDQLLDVSILSSYE